MDKFIPTLYKLYADYTNKFRAFPVVLDGLKYSERRILLSTYQIARTKLKKSATIDGHTIGNFHPHSSVYSTIVQLVNRKLLDGQGSFGSNIGIEPCGASASRYTEVKLSKFIDKTCFEFIDYVPWYKNELGQKEPETLPTMFPICFLGKFIGQGIGVGFKTLIPNYELKDLHKRLMWLLKVEKEKPTIKPISDCHITATNVELERLLTTGEAKIDVKGKLRESRRTGKIFLKAWPPFKSFEMFLKSPLFDNADVGYIDMSANGQTNIVFEITKKRNVNVIYDALLKFLNEKIIGSIPFKNNVVKDDLVKCVGIDEMFLTTFNNYVRINKVVLNQKIVDCQGRILELGKLEKIKPHLAIIMGQTDIIEIDEKMERISKLSDVLLDDVKYLFGKYRIRKLLKIDTDTTEVFNEMEIHKENLKGITAFVLNKYDEIKDWNFEEED